METLEIAGCAVAIVNGEPMIEDLQLAELLGFQRPRSIRQTINRLLEGGGLSLREVCHSAWQTRSTKGGRPSQGYLLSEKAVLKIITKSETPNADAITDQMIDVFMQYRRGQLQPLLPQSLPEALRLAADEAEKRQAIERQMLEMKPRAEFAAAVEVAPDAISVAQAAKVLGTGQRRLFAKLRELQWLSRRNEPYQRVIGQGLMDVKIGQFNHPETGLSQSITPLVTGKGLVKLQQLVSVFP